MTTQPVTWVYIKQTLQDEHIDWRRFFDERQLKEIDFSVVYANEFAHGTDGHNAKLIIARMAALLDTISQSITIEVERK